MPAGIVHCTILAVSLDCALCKSSSQSTSLDSPYYFLHKFGSQSPSLLEEIAQSLLVNPQVCVISFLKFALVFIDRFISMHVTLSLDLLGVNPPLSSIRSMASKREGSKDANISVTGALVERVSSSLPIYEDTKMFLNEDIKMKWQEVNDAFAGTFGEDLEDRQVYVNIQKSGLYQIQM